MELLNLFFVNFLAVCMGQILVAEINSPSVGQEISPTWYVLTPCIFSKILIITPTNAQLVFIIHCLPTCFDLYRSSSGHQGIPKVIKFYIKWL